MSYIYQIPNTFTSIMFGIFCAAVHKHLYTVYATFCHFQLELIFWKWFFRFCIRMRVIGRGTVSNKCLIVNHSPCARNQSKFFINEMKIKQRLIARWLANNYIFSCRPVCCIALNAISTKQVHVWVQEDPFEQMAGEYLAHGTPKMEQQSSRRYGNWVVNSSMQTQISAETR